jgi:hypothetical protein
MNLSKRQTKVPLGAGRYRHRTLIECDVVAVNKNDLASRMSLRHLAEILADQPELWLCGGDVPDSVTFIFENGRWQVIAEAVTLEGD